MSALMLNKGQSRQRHCRVRPGTSCAKFVTRALCRRKRVRPRPRLNLALSNRINQNSSVTLRPVTDTRDCVLLAWRSGARRAPALRKSLMRCAGTLHTSRSRSTMRNGLSGQRNPLNGLSKNGVHQQLRQYSRSK